MSASPVRAEELLLSLGDSEDPFEAVMTLTATDSAGQSLAVNVPLTPPTLAGLLQDLQHIDHLQRTEMGLAPRPTSTSPAPADAEQHTPDAPTSPAPAWRRMIDPVGLGGLRENPRSTRLFTVIAALCVVAGVILTLLQR